MISKICCRCEVEKLLENFSKCKRTKDGYLSYCKECNKNHVVNSNWYKNQYAQRKDYKSNWERNRYNTDINYKLSSNFRCRINSILTKKKLHKDNFSLNYLGCSLEQYKKHLESQFREDMTWLNHGKVWEVDHIKPLSKFDLSQEENIYKDFNYKNTQPLYKKENRVKKNSYD